MNIKAICLEVNKQYNFDDLNSGFNTSQLFLLGIIVLTLQSIIWVIFIYLYFMAILIVKCCIKNFHG